MLPGHSGVNAHKKSYFILKKKCLHLMLSESCSVELNDGNDFNQIYICDYKKSITSKKF